MNRNIRPRLSKRDGNGGAQPARRSGNQRDLTFQVELVEYQRNSSFRFSLVLSSNFGPVQFNSKAEDLCRACAGLRNTVPAILCKIEGVAA